MKIPHDQWPQGPNDGYCFVRSPYDPACRELVLALATVCQYTGNWDGARILERVAWHEYNKR